MSYKAKRLINTNRRARHDYFIETTYECGIVLSGSEVKSVKNGHISIREAYAEIRGQEIFLVNANIAEYAQASIFNHVPVRDRKLLLNKKEITRISNKVKQKGYTLIPLSVYVVTGWIKVEIALAQGKKKGDKRQDLKEREQQRDIDRAMSRRR